MTETVETVPRTPTSADVIAGNDDLLTEILRRLPVKSLLKFKSVSKNWLSLFSNPHFSRHQNSNSIAGLFLQRHTLLGGLVSPKIEFVPLDDDKPDITPFTSLPFVKGRAGFRILQSSNGLLCCCTCGVNPNDCRYYIYNPTTRQYTRIWDLGRANSSIVLSVNLAFDPSKSPHYKVVSVLGFDKWIDYGMMDFDSHIRIYSSETRLWRVSGSVFSASKSIHFDKGVFWNGAIHWVGDQGTSLCFDVDQERLRELPMPPLPDGLFEREVRYFGESQDHLHLVETYGPRTAQFNVYEMERDYSGWFVKYCVDLDTLTTAFPEMMARNGNYFNSPHWDFYGFAVLCILQGETDEGSFLVLHIPGKTIRYNLKDKTYKKLGDVEDINNEGFLGFRHSKAYQYMESLSRF
ncbi:hypothetical protein L1049_019519 [Liquidambar formosana]|uniref:F-box domain-containing protein n=1 Tax=Liquidambar formosana TaxID=63359 RepID=A0AAP0SBV0_LIQFO